MTQERHPRELGQHQQHGQPDVAKQLTWSILLVVCMLVWVALGYAVWLFFLR